jgi:hypothetical protein
VFKPRLVVGAEYKVEYYQPPGTASGDPPGLLYQDIDRHGVRIAVRCGTGDSLVLAALVACMPLCRRSHAESARCSLIPSSPRQTGTIGVFDFPTLLMALVSSVALLAVAKTVVEVMAFHILPLKSVYRWGQPPHSALQCKVKGWMPTTRHVVLCCRQYKNIDTLDFSDLTPADLAVMKKVREVVAVCECEGAL